MLVRTCLQKSRWAAAGLIWIAIATCLAQAQEASKRLGSDFIPEDGMLAAMASPANILISPSLTMFPTEIADAWCIENIGVAASKVESIRVIAATPGPTGSPFAAVFQFTEPVALESLAPQFLGDALDVDGLKCVEMRGPPETVLHQLRPDAIVLGSANYLANVLEAEENDSTGSLARYAAGTNHSGHLTAVLAVEPVRPLLTGLIQNQINMIPPPFVEFTEIPEHLDAIQLRVDLDSKENGIRLVLLGKDEASAERLAEIIGNGLEMGRAIGLAQAKNNIRGEGAVPAAMHQYMERMADTVVASVTPKVEGRRLTITAPINYGVTTQAMLMGMLMPAVQSARMAAGRAQTMNNLKQLGLAMHNHHAAFRELPAVAIVDDEDTPLLSWRVKLLPFLNEQELYEKFNLDEPWDSEHNLALLDEMPSVFRHPQIETPEGLTVYQAPVNEQSLFRPEGATRFREVLDGLSNTIMMFETDADSAVPWTKPADLEVNLEQPMSKLGVTDQGTFNVLISDGSVHTLSADMDPDLLKRLLTIAGKEVVRIE